MLGIRSNKTRRKALCTAALAVVLSAAVLPAVSLHAGVQKLTFTTSKGLKVKVLTDSTMDFVHAELLVFYKDKFKNPAIPTLTLINLFDKDVNPSGSNLMSILKRLGNDYEVEQTPEYFILKVNFLPDRLQQFAHLVKGVYSYKPFMNIKINPDSYTYRKREQDTAEKFKDSVDNYWKRYYKKEDWAQDTAYQIAYSMLFQGDPLGNSLVTASSLKSATLAQVRTFYQRAFRLPNSLLIIKGDFKPHLMRGYLSGEFSSFKKQIPEVPVDKEIQINNERKVVIYSIKNGESPVLYWFDAIEPLSDEQHISSLVLNNVLFGFPFGRIYRNPAETGFSYNNLEIRSEITNHEKVSVICNTIELRPRDIEQFIRIADREKKKLSIKKVERIEYLNTLSYFAGKIKVDSQFFDNDINHEILLSSYSFKRTGLMDPNLQPTQFISLEGLNEKIENPKNFDNSPRGTIVIVGDYDIIRRYLKDIKPIVYNY